MSAGKGDSPRNVGAKFKDNWDGIAGMTGGPDRRPVKETSTRKRYVYGSIAVCPAGCDGGVMDSGGVTPWSEPIPIPCPFCSTIH